MMLFMLLGLPLIYLVENHERLDAARIYALRHVLLLSAGASVAAAVLRMVVDSLFPLDYFWVPSGLWFLLVDWLVPLSVVLAVFIPLYRYRKARGEDQGLQVFQTIFLLVFWVSQLIRLAARLNQLEPQDIFIYPAYLVLAFLSLSILFRMRFERRAPLLVLCLIPSVLLVGGALSQTLSHMNYGIPAFLILGVLGCVTVFFNLPAGLRLLFPGLVGDEGVAGPKA